jgi:hypothetical protein
MIKTEFKQKDIIVFTESNLPGLKNSIAEVEYVNKKYGQFKIDIGGTVNVPTNKFSIRPATEAEKRCWTLKHKKFSYVGWIKFFESSI